MKKNIKHFCKKVLKSVQYHTQWRDWLCGYAVYCSSWCNMNDQCSWYYITMFVVTKIPDMHTSHHIPGGCHDCVCCSYYGPPVIRPEALTTGRDSINWHIMGTSFKEHMFLKLISWNIFLKISKFNFRSTHLTWSLPWEYSAPSTHSHSLVSWRLLESTRYKESYNTQIRSHDKTITLQC